MTGNLDYSYKDSTPAETVARIRSILNAHGITTKEIWQDTNIPNCYAMSVCINGTTLRSNGKGITRELAQASGYGELMERLQMGITASAASQKAALHAELSILKKTSTQQLLKDHQKWYELLSVNLTACTGQVMTLEEILHRFADKDGMVSIREYVLPDTGETVAFPAQIIQRIYCTNGCAAGNTPQEALVQAISEIIERHHQLRVVHEDLALPNVPDEVLMNYHGPWATICHLRNHGFHVEVKDCSFGESFPVLCVCLVDKKSGRYHTHFGAFPVFEIALERALTESFQGRSLETVAQFQNLSEMQAGRHSLRVMGNEVFFGSGERTFHFFCGTPDYPYNPHMGFSGRDNRQLLRQCLDYLKAKGLDVLVRNHSALGFPTYQVLVPGFSEVMIHRLHPKLDDTCYSQGAALYLRNPSQAALADGMALMMHLQQMDQFGSKVRHARDFSFCSRLPLKLDYGENEFLMVTTLCHVNYAMGRMSEVLQGIDKLLTLPCGDAAGKLVCLRRYLTLSNQGYDQQSIAAILLHFHPEEYNWLQSALSKRNNPFAEFVLNCDLVHCQNCPMKSKCCYQSNHALSALIAEKSSQLNPAAFIHIMKTISNSP